MIDYCHNRLLRWAEWSALRSDGFYRNAQYRYEERTPKSTGNAPGILPLDAASMETDAGVALIRLNHYRLGNTLAAFYRDHSELSAEMLAIMLGTSTRSMWRNLHSGH